MRSGRRTIRSAPERCYRLARVCFDLDVARELKLMGDDFMEIARGRGADLPGLRAAARRGSGHPSNGGIGHG
jgi:hypothetical protein